MVMASFIPADNRGRPNTNARAHMTEFPLILDWFSWAFACLLQWKRTDFSWFFFQSITMIQWFFFFLNFWTLRPQDHQNLNGLPTGFWNVCNYFSWCNISDIFKLILNYSPYWLLFFRYCCLIFRIRLGYVLGLSLCLASCPWVSFPQF